MSSGWVKLHKKTLKWEWFRDSQTFHYFVYCVIKANYEQKMFMGVSIERGQFAASRQTIYLETGISIQSQRTIEARLTKSQNLTIKSTSKFIIYTINNYEEYQQLDLEATQSLTSNQHSTNIKSTTTKEIKKERKDIYAQNRFADFWAVYPLHVGKKKAAESYQKAIKKGTTPETIILGAIAYKNNSYRKQEYTKHAATWINGECWNDKLEQKVYNPWKN